MSDVSANTNSTSPAVVHDEEAGKDSKQLEEKTVEQPGSPSEQEDHEQEEKSQEGSAEAAAEADQQPESGENADDDASKSILPILVPTQLIMPIKRPATA